MPSKVYFAPFGGEATEEEICERTKHLFRAAALEEMVTEGRHTGVKTHFGERGNTSYLRPAPVKAVVEEVRAAGGEPCLVETSTLYRGQRHNAVDHFNLAVEHGFGPEQMGCPLLFLDGLRGNRHVEVEVDLEHCRTVAVAEDFTLIPAVIVISHVTGHQIAGFAGAIKNVAMGLASRAGKLRQHCDGRPEVDEEACIACGACAEWCPEDAIALEEAAQIDHELCIGCGQCVATCPVGAVGFSWNAAPEKFNQMMAEYAFGILRDTAAGFLTFIRRTSRECNCWGEPADIVAPDLGALASPDPVAIDQAAADLLNEAHGSDLFQELWPDSNYTAQFSHGEQIGLGSRRYELVRA